jgi:hypothetical protein
MVETPLNTNALVRGKTLGPIVETSALVEHTVTGHDVQENARLYSIGETISQLDHAVQQSSEYRGKYSLRQPTSTIETGCSSSGEVPLTSSLSVSLCRDVHFKFSRPLL